MIPASGIPASGTPAPGEARARLLAAVVDDVARNGLADLSLRGLARRIGTSHRMLIYHFGSKEGLLADVVAAVEEGQRAVLDSLAAQPDTPVRDVMDRFWAGLVDPGVREHERLFFEVVALALQGCPGTQSLRAGLVEPWLQTVAARSGERGLPADVARAQARLGMAVTRGLLLDLLATDDLDGVNAAWRVFADAFAGPAAPD